MKGTLLGVVIMAALVYLCIWLAFDDPFWMLVGAIGLVAVLWPVVKVGERVNRWSERRRYK